MLWTGEQVGITLYLFLARFARASAEAGDARGLGIISPQTDRVLRAIQAITNDQDGEVEEHELSIRADD